MIQNIHISKIKPHPHNPRKDLGDLSELADSIRASGILQNLSVVPCFSKAPGVGADDPRAQGEKEYIVVIGHRRLAAAKMAGLTEVPCAVVEMDERMQIATMLLENIQRSDLTVYEQARGFQMMLDLGETVGGIVEKTGFSDTTVRRRIRLMELDEKKFKASVERGGTLEDYARLEKIQDKKLKNSVLEAIGTANFTWKLDQAIEKEAMKPRKAALNETLSKFAKYIEKPTKGMECVRNFWNFKDDGFKTPVDADKAEYFYTVSDTNMTLYKKDPNAGKKKTKSKKEKEYESCEAKLKELSKRAYEHRYDFVKNYSNLKKHFGEIMALAVKGLTGYGRAEPDDVLKLLGVEKPEFDEKTSYDEKNKKLDDLIFDQLTGYPERVLFIASYCRFGDSQNHKYFQARSWELKNIYSPNSQLDRLYDALNALGYEMSDEERALREGTHELFSRSAGSDKGHGA